MSSCGPRTTTWGPRDDERRHVGEEQIGAAMQARWRDGFRMTSHVGILDVDPPASSTPRDHRPGHGFVNDPGSGCDHTTDGGRER